MALLTSSSILQNFSDVCKVAAAFVITGGHCCGVEGGKHFWERRGQHICMTGIRNGAGAVRAIETLTSEN